MIIKALMYHNGLRDDIKILKTVKTEYLVELAIMEAQDKMENIQRCVLKCLCKN